MAENTGDWASLLMHDWASLLVQTLEESPLLLLDTFHKRNVRFNGWQCHILACLFSSLAPRIRSEMADWNWICRNVDASESSAVQIAMKEAFHAIKQAESFMESCDCEDWRIKTLASTMFTEEAFSVHIHNLFWSISGLLLATRVALRLSEDRLNAVMERQVQCWSTTIARYFCLGAELLDLRQMFLLLAEEENSSHDEVAKEKEATSVLGIKSEEIPAIVKLLTRRLQWILSGEPSEIESLFGDLKINSRDLSLEKRSPICSEGYFVGSWSGLRVMLKACSLSRFHKQAPTLLRMRNPFILQLIGWSADLERGPEACYMVMEAVNTDLKSFMKTLSESKGGEPPFVFHVALDIMLQIARGVWYLHKHGLAHGSLRASCVLLESSKVPELAGEGYARVKLCEIGQAKLSSLGESMEEEFGADVHSFGQLCMEILTGKQPAEDDGLPSGIPTLLSECMHACCDANCENRPEFGVICGLFRHLKLIVTSPHRLERVLNFFPEEDTHVKKSPPKFYNSSFKAASPDMDFQLELININVNALHLSTPPEIYPLVAAEADSQKATTLGLRDLERMSGELLARIEQENIDGGIKFVVSNAGTLKASLVEGFSGLLESWCSTTLGMGTLEMWLPHLPVGWKLLHTVALGLALCLRYVAKTPPKFGFYSEEGIDGFYPIEPQNILLNCQFKAALLLDNSPTAWKRLTQWVGVHPQVGSGDNILLSIEAYTTYYFGHLLSSIINTRNVNLQASKPLQSSLDQHFEFVLTNLAMRCMELRCLSMTEVVSVLVNEYRPSRRP